MKHADEGPTSGSRNTPRKKDEKERRKKKWTQRRWSPICEHSTWNHFVNQISDYMTDQKEKIS